MTNKKLLEKLKEDMEMLLMSIKNDNIKVTKKGNIKITNIGYFFDGEKIL